MEAVAEFKGTAKPWKTAAEAGVNNAVFHGVVASLADGPDYGWIAVVAPEHHYGPMHAEELEANARLIAAAPDLLEALQYVADLLNDDRLKDLVFGIDHDIALAAATELAKRSAHAAIKKALEGG